MQVSLNGVDWTVSRRSFTYYNYDQLHISLFEPEGGPTAGGTAITIHGSSFMYTQHLKYLYVEALDELLLEEIQ